MRLKLQKTGERLLWNGAATQGADADWLELLDDGDWVEAECAYAAGGLRVVQIIDQVAPPDWAAAHLTGMTGFVPVAAAAVPEPPVETKPLPVPDGALYEGGARLRFPAELYRGGRRVRGAARLAALDGAEASLDLAEVLGALTERDTTLFSGVAALRFEDDRLMIEVNLRTTARPSPAEAEDLLRALLRYVDTGWPDEDEEAFVGLRPGEMVCFEEPIAPVE